MAEIALPVKRRNKAEEYGFVSVSFRPDTPTTRPLAVRQQRRANLSAPFQTARSLQRQLPSLPRDVMNRIFTVAVTRRRPEDEKPRRNGQGFVNLGGLQWRQLSRQVEFPSRLVSQEFVNVLRKTMHNSSFNCQRGSTC